MATTIREGVDIGALAADLAAAAELARHDRAVIEAFRVRVIRVMGGLRLIFDDDTLTDLVELDAVLDAIRAVPVST